MGPRRLPFALAAAVLSLSFAPAALAGDDDLPDVNRAAQFGVADVALAESGLPKDGSLKAAPADAPPSAEAKAVIEFIESTAKAKGSSAWTTTRALVTADGKPVAVVLADLSGDGDGVLAAVKEEATKKGWAVRTLGYSTRIVVAVGPEAARTQALEAQTAFAVKMIGIKLGAAREMQGRGSDAYALANGLLRLDPKNAAAHLVAAEGISQRAAEQKDQEMAAKAMPHYKAALDKDATSPLSGDALLSAKGAYGQHVLTSVNGAPTTEGRDLLAEVVKALPGSTIRPEVAIGWRYDLACAYGRLKEKDAAFEQLSKVLELNVKTPVRGISHWRKDPDFDNLKDDPRWAKLLEKYPVGKDEDGEGGEGGMEEPGMEDPGMEGGK